MPDDNADVETLRDRIWEHVSNHFNREEDHFSTWCRERRSALDPTKLDRIFARVIQDVFDDYEGAYRYDNIKLKLDDPEWRLQREEVRFFEDEFLRQLKLLFALCESPIEQLLGVAIIACSTDGYNRVKFDATRLRDDREGTKFTSQYSLFGYRADFAFRTSYNEQEQFLVVECDGHEFHDRTKEQASRDRCRDRVMLEAGIPVIRFTGSDVWADAMGCAEEISSQLSRHSERMITKTVSPALKRKLDKLT